MNTGLDGNYVNPYELDVSETTSEEKTVVGGAFDKKVRLSLNNWPLCVYDPNCEDLPDTNTGTTPEQGGDTIGDLDDRTYGVTFETIRQNIASFNFDTDLSDKKHLIRTYYIGDGKTITQEVDMRTLGVIYTKLSGDTGYDGTLVKTTHYTNSRQFSTTYSTE